MQRTTASELAIGAESDEYPYLTFRLREETFARGILFIKEDHRIRVVYAGADDAKCVPGVINLRGRVVPVIDLGVRFAREEIVPTGARAS